MRRRQNKRATSPAGDRANSARAHTGRRRVAVGATILIVGAAVAAMLGLRHSGTASFDGPIILISIDTLRADHLPVYGYAAIETPAIDALAKDGIVFERAYSHSPQTLPAHTSILSGKLPFEHGVRDNIGFSVAAGERLLPEVLRERGFATAGVVSAYVLRKETGISRGFDFFDSELPQATPDMSFAQVQRDGAESVAIAKRWLQNQRGNRFFLFLHLYEPHTPYRPPDRYARYAPYDGEIAYADELVARLVQILKARDSYDPATIVLLSDHGEGLGDHGEREHGVFLYEEAIRVPLIVKLPSGRGRSRRIETPVQHIDIVPTLVDLAGIAVPSHLRGRSWTPALLESGTLAESGIYAEALYPRYHFGWSELYALTDSRYRYIRAPRDELYDLQQDPQERRNLVADRSQARLAMRGALDRLIAGRRLTAPGAVSDEDRERLQALGYVGSQSEVPIEAPADTLADPKDKVQTLERYRAAVVLAGDLKYRESAALFRAILDENPGMKDVWIQLANVQIQAGQIAEALQAYQAVLRLEPTNTNGLIGAAATLLKLRRLDEAAGHAELAARMAAPADRRVRATAYELLAKVALARSDGDAAERYAQLAQKSDPTLPLPVYIRARRLHTAGRYEEALPLFEAALGGLEATSTTMADIHYYAGDTYARLGHERQAEAAFQREIRLFPHNTRAYTGLAMLYRSASRDADAERTLDTLIRAVPTVEGYAWAIKAWRIFGERGRASALRADAHRRFGTAAQRRALERELAER